MKKTSYFALLVIAFLFTSLSCNNQDDIIPYVYVNFEIDVVNHPELGAVGGVKLFKRVFGQDVGLNGVIIYRQSIEDFIAYEATCTYDLNPVTLDEDAWFAVDTACNSKFSLPLDGAPVDGPAGLPLERYQTYFNPQAGVLRVHN